MKRLLLVFASCIALTSCGWHPLAPHTAVKAARPTSRQVSRTILGVDIATDQNYSRTQARAYGHWLISYVKGALHANSVGFVWDLCSPGFHSNIVTRCTQSLSPADVGILVSEAKAAHLLVQLRPLIRVGPPSGWNISRLSWEGFIQPYRQQLWFANLLRAERPYLILAKGEQFVTGTELRGLATSVHWSSFLASARILCSCGVSVSASHTQYTLISKLPINTVGVDWYPHLNLPADAAQPRVTAQWEDSLASMASNLRPRVMLDEVSILGVTGAYQNPANWNLHGSLDPQVQARYFIAACQTVAHYRMKGIYFYEIPLNDDPYNPLSFPAFFVGNAGSRAIAECAKILSIS